MAQEPQGRWPAGWIRAALPTAVLACLEDGPLHGYAIAQALAARGFGAPKGGSLYPALGRLEESGAVSAAWVGGQSGPGRRQYTLTDSGRARLREERADWLRLAQALQADPRGPDAGDAIAPADQRIPRRTR